jgi:two-component system phosphate regulon sensor histidine kinase PhoR
MATASFRTQLFLAELSTGVIALVVAGVLFTETMRVRADEQLEQTLVAEARLASELLSRSATVTAGASLSVLDDEADRMGRLLDARVTLIAADGRVVGDSAETLESIASMDNHATRPEVLEAKALGVGRSRRRSDTLNIDMLYVAVPVQNPAAAFVRVAVPVTNIRKQLQPIINLTLVALGLALASAAAIAGVISWRLGQRVQSIAQVARR